jgi:hypothetical protein
MGTLNFITLLLPSKWTRPGLMTRVAVFTLTVFVVSAALQHSRVLFRDEAFLLSAILGVSLAYWVPPIPKQKYTHWIFTHFVLIVGAYLFMFKVPVFFSGFMSYRVAGIVCLALYSACCWFLIRRKEKLERHAEAKC